MAGSQRQDVYHRVTTVIVRDLEQGVRPWLKPWHAQHPGGPIRPLRANGVPYRGINVITLWSEAMTRGFSAPTWVTFRQAVELGGHVRKGETASFVVYASKLTRTETDPDNGQTVGIRLPFLKTYPVFNVEQTSGLPAHFYGTPPPPPEPIARIDHAEAFFAATGADIAHGGDMAYYNIAQDHIQMPPVGAFVDAEAYYATLAHECAHWTRHPQRLDRDFGRKRWGDAGYALEELVAELASAFLCADLHLALEPRHDHADYIGAWLKVLNTNTRAIFTAASHAQQAADFLHQLQPGAAGEPAAQEPEGIAIPSPA
jgi:antirestriction protein ArdC